MAAGDAEGVVHHRDLAVGTVAGADADDRNGQCFGNLARQLGRHAFQHQQLNAGQFQILCVLQQLFGGQFVAPLYLIAAEHVDRLRRQARPHTGTARSASIFTVSHSQLPPSSFTMLAPARISSAALAKVCSGVA